MLIPFEWDVISNATVRYTSTNFTYRAKVFGGWLVKTVVDESVSMVFIEDKNHEWEI